MKSKVVTLAAAAVFSCLGATAHAVPVLAGVWYEFSFTDTTTLAGACTSCTPSSGTPTVFAGDSPWTYTSGAYGSTLIVTDAFLIGDQFAVFDTGILAGFTFPVAVGGACGDDPLGCVGIASSGAFVLAPSTLHSIDILPVGSPFGGGAAYFEVIETVPEPGTMLLLGFGVSSLGLVRRRRR